MSETRKDEPCIHGVMPYRCDECRFFGTRYPATPTPPEQGEGVVARVQRTAAWLRTQYIAVENGTVVDGQKVYDDLMALIALARVAPQEPHIKRVKVDELLLPAFAGSRPVTIRVAHEPDGDLQFVFTRHDCATPPAAETGDTVTVRAEEWTRLVAMEANAAPAPPAAERGRVQEILWGNPDSDDTFGEPMVVREPKDAQQIVAAPAAETGEPVAWVPMDSEGDKWWQNTRESEKQAKASLTRQKDYDGFEFVMVPLYAEAMVERVARHLFECDNLPLPADLQWDDATEQHQESYRRSARAILAAANMPAAGTGTAVEARDAFYRSYRAIVQGVAEHQNAVGDVHDLSHELNAVVAAERRDERALCVSLVQGARKSVSTDSATLFNAGVDAARAALSAETGTT